MKRAEYEHTGFGKWKWVDHRLCDRCGREILFPWEGHSANGVASTEARLFGVYEDLDSGCYTAVYHGQDATRSEPLLHFVGNLRPTGVNALAASKRNQLQGIV
jgi:hypothetical protein